MSSYNIVSVRGFIGEGLRALKGKKVRKTDLICLTVFSRLEPALTLAQGFTCCDTVFSRMCLNKTWCLASFSQRLWGNLLSLSYSTGFRIAKIAVYGIGFYYNDFNHM